MANGIQNDRSSPLKSASRDIRLDILRGLAVLIVVVDHIRDNPVRNFMPVSLGFSDLAEGFLFVSGYVSGLSYGRRLTVAGFRACQKRALRRCCELYLTNMLVLAAFLAMMRSFDGRWIDLLHPADRTRGGEVLLAPGSYVPRILALGWEPLVFSVLPFYIGILGFLPSILWLLQRCSKLLLCVSIALYCSVQSFPDVVALPEPWRTAWYFNPFAWQIVFVLGAFCSMFGERALPWLSRGGISLVAAFLVGEVAFLKGVFFGPTWLPWADKPTLGPIRIVHFACVIALVVRFLPAASHAFWSNWRLVPLVTCGRNALVAYAIGGLFSVSAGIALVLSGDGAMAILMTNVFAVSATLVAASAWLSIKNAVRWRMDSDSDAGVNRCSSSRMTKPEPDDS